MVSTGFLAEISVKDHCVDLRVGFGEERKSWSTVMAGVSSRCARRTKLNLLYAKKKTWY